jgi:hypothetical protein
MLFELFKPFKLSDAIYNTLCVRRISCFAAILDVSNSLDGLYFLSIIVTLSYLSWISAGAGMTTY